MRWSWSLGRVAGIEIRLHVTFLALLAGIGILSWLGGAGMQGTLLGLAFMAAVFGTVLLHEFGHALMGQHLGMRTLDITLLPIGGVARVERLPQKPLQEVLMAGAGPAVNLVLAAGILAALGFAGRSLVPPVTIRSGADFLGQLAWVNLVLAAFNLLPAFPMDGGRVLRAVLSTRLDRVRATRAAAVVGQGMAIVFGVFGVLFNPMLIFIAVFVWIGAAAESTVVAAPQAGFEDVPVQRVMVTDFHSLAPGDPLSVPLDLLMHSFQRDFPVCERGTYEGLLTRRALVDALAKGDEGMRVADAMRIEVPALNPNEPLATALPKLRASGEGALPVLRGHCVVGLLTKENLGGLPLSRTVQGHA